MGLYQVMLLQSFLRTRDNLIRRGSTDTNLCDAVFFFISFHISYTVLIRISNYYLYNGSGG